MNCQAVEIPSVAYNSADGLVSRVGPSGATSSVSDGNGNLTRDGAATFDYDAAGRVTLLV